MEEEKLMHKWTTGKRQWAIAMLMGTWSEAVYCYVDRVSLSCSAGRSQS